MGNNFDICQTGISDKASEATIEQLAFEGNFQRLEEQLKLPAISQQLSDLLAIKKPFINELNNIAHVKKINYNGGLYIGEISRFLSPNGWGKMYCENGDVIIGQFQSGVPKGKCFYGQVDGSYYQGQISNKKINCIDGVYYCPDFQYIGGFKNNLYHGQGKILKKNWVLEGDFDNGKIQKGMLEWKQNSRDSYIYHGDFNEHMEMHGNGVLEETLGTYVGEFRNNKKHGKGQYKYINGNKFSGHYIDGLKQGFGELISRYEDVIYRGEWGGDVPINNPQSISRSQVQLPKKVSGIHHRLDSIRSTASLVSS